MKYSHVVFDIDGTIIDSEKSVLKSLRKTIFEELNELKDLDELKFALGIPGEDALKKLGVKNIDSVLKKWDDYFKEYKEDIVVFNGIEEVLNNLKLNKINLGIITSKTKTELKDDFLCFKFSELFQIIICADDTKRHKPFKDPMEKYLEISNAKRDEVIYIGDSIYDRDCAVDAKVDFGLALWGATDKEIKSTYKLNNPKDIESITLNYDKEVFSLACELQYIAKVGLKESKFSDDKKRYKRVADISVELSNK